MITGLNKVNFDYIIMMSETCAAINFHESKVHK